MALLATSIYFGVLVLWLQMVCVYGHPKNPSRKALISYRVHLGLFVFQFGFVTIKLTVLEPGLAGLFRKVSGAKLFQLLGLAYSPSSK